MEFQGTDVVVEVGNEGYVGEAVGCMVGGLTLQRLAISRDYAQSEEPNIDTACRQSSCRRRVKNARCKTFDDNRAKNWLIEKLATLVSSNRSGYWGKGGRSATLRW